MDHVALARPHDPTDHTSYLDGSGPKLPGTKGVTGLDASWNVGRRASSMVPRAPVDGAADLRGVWEATRAR